MPALDRARPGALVAATALAMLAGSACSDPQAKWCTELADQQDLGALVAAVGSGDLAASEAAMTDLEELADSAPEPIREEMDQVVTVLSEVVDLRLDSGDLAPDELENLRTRVNQRLDQVSVSAAAVAGWAETECGIALD
jgi:ElaB/YqjD/DUF883 family membrane-anchored ribosome-binding protein